MKKIYRFTVSLLIFILTFHSAKTQITIHSSDLPTTGSIYRVSIGQAFTGMDETLANANYIWNYSQLISTSQTLDTFVAVFTTGFIYSSAFILNSTYAEKSNTPQVTIPGFLTVDYEYDFYKRSTSAYVHTGFGARMNSIPLPVLYSPTDTIYRFPLQYGNTDSSASAFSVTIPGLGYYGGNKTRTDTVDGWGTLITPYGTFNSIRVKSVINEKDSMHIDMPFPFGFSIQRAVVTEYKWLATGQGIPLLQINTSGNTVTQIIYRDSLRVTPLSVNNDSRNILDGNDLTIFPNPSSGKMLVYFNHSKAENIFVDITDLAGKKIFSQDFGKRFPGDNMIAIDLADYNFSSGMYFLNLNIGNRNVVKKITLVK